MRLNHLNTKRNVLLESLHSILEDIFQSDDLDPIAEDFNSIKLAIEQVIADPEGASEEHIINALRGYKELVNFISETGSKLADAKKVLDTANAYQSGNLASHMQDIKKQ